MTVTIDAAMATTIAIAHMTDDLSSFEGAMFAGGFSEEDKFTPFALPQIDIQRSSSMFRLSHR